LPDFTPRTNPWNFPGLRGPGVFNIDGSLVKEVKITEKLKWKFQVDAFNLLNNMSWGDPSTSVDDSNFGQSTNRRISSSGGECSWECDWSSKAPPFSGGLVKFVDFVAVLLPRIPRINLVRPSRNQTTLRLLRFGVQPLGCATQRRLKPGLQTSN